MPQDNSVFTTYSERGVHLAMKRFFCPDESLHERKIGRFVADAFDGNTIFEIQTASFALLRKKVQFYLENTDYNVLIVRPLAQNRRVLWLDEQTGALAHPPRLSPKHEDLRAALPQLFYLKEHLGDPRLSFCFPLMEISELRLLNGYAKNKKRGSTSLDRIAGEIYSLNYVRSREDVRNIVLPHLPKDFSRAELSTLLRLTRRNLWAAQELLCELEILSSHKDGKKLVFHLN